MTKYNDRNTDPEDALVDAFDELVLQLGNPDTRERAVETMLDTAQEANLESHVLVQGFMRSARRALAWDGA